MDKVRAILIFEWKAQLLTKLFQVEESDFDLWLPMEMEAILAGRMTPPRDLEAGDAVLLCDLGVARCAACSMSTLIPTGSVKHVME